MSEKVTNILGYLTLFAILGAIWVLFGEDPTREQGGRGERTFAGLEARINEVHVIELRRGDTVTHIDRDAEAGVWRLRERAGYVVSPEKPRALLRGIALSERREPKTSNSSRYRRLGLGASGLQVTLFDDTEGELLTFQMGKRKGSANGKSLTYVVQERDTRSWLVTGLAEATETPSWWLDKTLLNIDMRRVSDLTVSGVWLTRKLGDTNFKLQGLRGDEKAGPSWLLRDPARVWANLSFDDVRELTNPLAEPVSTSELSTYDGLTLHLSLYRIDGGVWAKVSAVFDPELQSKGDAGVLPAAPADGAAEAEAITNAVRGWVFKLQDADLDILQRTRADFMEATTE
ncbi:MAG: hypothetical protein COB37_02640 [Kordiimonadales bacterium]|nr:MAG: hypothetical protein COB37_02640 [Kordiimonadales bacterium]